MARKPFLAGIVIAIAVVAAYAGSFSGAFVYDDAQAVVGNASLRNGGLAAAFSPPKDGSPVTGRPVLNASFALDWRLGGGRSGPFHRTNLLIHLAGALILFGIVRRTLLLGCGSGTDPTFPALAVAVIWAVHPLQTEAVTYVSQRSESLMGLCYLLTLYSFIRGPGRREWLLLSATGCWLGMASKEVMVSAPLVVLLYDRTFVAGSFGRAWRSRRGYYCSLAGSWGLLAILVAGAGSRHGTAGFSTSVPWWGYLEAQAHAIVHYLRLIVWPRPLVFLYDRTWHLPWPQLAADAMLVALMLTAVAIGVVKRTAWGFAGACFFALLAPTSSVLPISTEIMAEHRLYLPLAAALALVLVPLTRRWPRLAAGLVPAAAAVLLALTVHRNRIYRSALALWSDTVAKVPHNPYALNNLGIALVDAGRASEALDAYSRSLAVKPDYAEAHMNRGLAYVAMDQLPAAASEFTSALRLDPGYAKARFNLAEAQFNLGNELARRGKLFEAIDAYRAALQTDPANAAAHNNLGLTCRRAGRLDTAVAEYTAAIRLQPDFVAAHDNLGAALAASGRYEAAAGEFETALRINPGDAAARHNLALLAKKSAPR